MSSRYVVSERFHSNNLWHQYSPYVSNNSISHAQWYLISLAYCYLIPCTYAKKLPFKENKIASGIRLRLATEMYQHNIYIYIYVCVYEWHLKYTSFHSTLQLRQMSVTACQITSLTIVCSTVYSGADQRKHRSSASLAFMRGIHRWPINSPHEWPLTRKMFLFDDVIMQFDLANVSIDLIIRCLLSA